MAFLILIWAAIAFPAHSESRFEKLPPQLSNDDFIPFAPKQAALGQLLFYDKILSGNKNISCGTCHHHDFGSSDGLSLGIGEGGTGVGTKRTLGVSDDRIRKRIPRNAPGLWNLGAKEIKALFHDGRLTKSDLFENGFNSPAEEWLPKGFSNLLAVQGLMPMASQFEMAGNPKENEVAGAAHNRIDLVWPILAKRVRNIPEYGEKFVEAFASVNSPKDISIVEIGEALSAFINSEWRSFDAPFDDYLAGKKDALSAQQISGMKLFYGKARCSICHLGALFSDQKFHALGIPPFGPGRTRLFDPVARDVGLMGESDRIEDAYRFRTPMLRNVALTAPYGHNGAYSELEGIVRHHLAPLEALNNWKPEMANLPRADWLAPNDFVVWQDKREIERVRASIEIDPVDLSDGEVDHLIAFLHALTGKSGNRRPMGRPLKVPSGLSVD